MDEDRGDFAGGREIQYRKPQQVENSPDRTPQTVRLRSLIDGHCDQAESSLGAARVCNLLRNRSHKTMFRIAEIARLLFHCSPARGPSIGYNVLLDRTS